MVVVVVGTSSKSDQIGSAGEHGNKGEKKSFDHKQNCSRKVEGVYFCIPVNINIAEIRNKVSTSIK